MPFLLLQLSCLLSNYFNNFSTPTLQEIARRKRIVWPRPPNAIFVTALPYKYSITTISGSLIGDVSNRLLFLVWQFCFGFYDRAMLRIAW